MSAAFHGGVNDEELAALGYAAADIIDLSANLHPDGPPAAVLEAFRAARVDRYPSIDAAPLRAALAALHGVSSESVIVTPGASAAIALAVASLVTPGDRCAVFPPTFGEYERAIRAVEGIVAPGVASPPNFEVALPPPSDLAVLCNPNNPTGRDLARPEVEAIVERSRHLILDAAYEPFVEESWDAIDLVRDGVPVVVVHSLTKLFAIPGIRLGYIVALEPIAARLRRRQPPWPVGGPEIAAGCAAVAMFEERRRTVARILERRARLEATFAELGVRLSPSRTNFAFADVGDAAAFRLSMLRHGFLVRDGSSFGLPGWARLSVPAEAEMPRLQRALIEVLAARQ